MPDRIVYKVMSETELQQMQRDGMFCGSPVDVADGYIHLSCGSQLAATLDKHFHGVTGLMLVAVDLAQLGGMPCAGSRRAEENCSRTSMATCRSRRWWRLGSWNETWPGQSGCLRNLAFRRQTHWPFRSGAPALPPHAPIHSSYVERLCAGAS